ncbi:MAG TPA: hypothetical protein ENN20_05845 [Candidatus Marinimicrobia bacterium]|nr:hypothetical protein [Candidatus Neomarinimicrobiota bacterium]
MNYKVILILTLPLALLFMFCETNLEPDDDTDDADSIAPAIPTGLALDEDASVEGVIKISWSANTESDLRKYHIYRATGADSLPLYTLIHETVLTSYADSNMEYFTEYFYRISAVDKNNNESELSTALLATTVNINPPGIPQNFTVYAYNLPGEGPSVELHWTANPEADLSHYNVYRHTSAQLTIDSSYFVARTTNNLYVDTSVEVGVKYYYRITAVDKGNWSSNPVNAKADTPLPQPSLLFPKHMSTTATRSPGYSWERVEGAARYELIIQTSLQSGEVHRIEVAQPTDGTSVSKNTGVPTLNPNTKYYWLVAVFSSDNSSANTYSDSTWVFWTPSQ